MANKKQTTEVLTCECNSAEHIVMFNIWEDEPEVYVSIHLAPLPLWKRLGHAVKYIFGHRCQYGDFENIILGTRNYEKMALLTNHLKKFKEE